MSDRTKLFQELATLLHPDEFSVDPQVREAHAGDKWFAARIPDAVATPRSTSAVLAVVSFAAKHRIPITPRGAGYGYVGGCVPVAGGISLSLAKMNSIKEIHSGDFVAVVEPGVLTADLQAAVEAQGLYYPPDPASRANCSIGGNIATNAGGPRCLKYGVTRDYILGLEVVLATGELVRLGSRTHKNKTGFDLARLFVGSEGMLGVITEATLKLLPLPPYRGCISAGFSDAAGAAQAIGKTFRSGLLPAALEIADELTVAAARKRTGSKKLDGCKALLIVELDGQEESVQHEIEFLGKILNELSPVFQERAFGNDECETLWQVRREFSFALRDTGLTKLNEDVVVPRSRVEDLFQLARHLQDKHKLLLACFGHAGDGNIHVNVMVDETKPEQRLRSEAALDELFQTILSWGGVITGEHGIGLAKKQWWNSAVSSASDSLHKQIKAALDPHGILNPGKFLD